MTAETLLSVGIDIGTSTTQLVIARLTLENRANPFSVPRVAIAGREVLYRSAIHFTPLRSETEIDGAGVREIVAEEYRKSGYEKGQIATGAVIITGETARKENAREVLASLAGFAGDFVVATAGPDLESILAARGAGADTCSREERAAVLHCDIGGGTSNLALYDRGELRQTGCLDVGGRLIKIDRGSGAITYLSPVLSRLPGGCPLRVGQRAEPQALAPVLAAMVSALEQAAGLRPPDSLLEAFLTQDTRWQPVKPDILSFSGGVADCIYDPPAEDLAYGDMGVLLGRAIRQSQAMGQVRLRRGAETIRATVVGAGGYSMDVSGSTIFYREMAFPMKNLPILKLTEAEEQGEEEQVERAVTDKLRWFADQGGLTQTALALRGEENPAYPRVARLARGLARGLEPLIRAGFAPVVVVERDMAKVLGQAMAPLIAGPLLCLDGVGVESGDYIDIGAPVANGAVLPVMIKTLVFSKE